MLCSTFAVELTIGYQALTVATQRLQDDYATVREVPAHCSYDSAVMNPPPLSNFCDFI